MIYRKWDPANCVLSLRWWERPLFRLKPAYVVIEGGRAYFFRHWRGRVVLYHEEVVQEVAQ